MIFDVDVDRLGLQRGGAERKEHFQRLNFQLGVIERALERAPHAGFGQRVKRVHDQETAVGAQQRAGAQIHEVRSPDAARIVAALDGAEKIGIGRRGLENDRRSVFFIVRQHHVHAVDAKRIALRCGRDAGRAVRRRTAAGLLFAFALLEGFEIVENVVAHFLEIFGNQVAGIFFLQLLDEAVHQHGGRFLLEVAQFAGQFARKRERLAVDDGEFLAELLVLAFQILGDNRFQLAFVHHLRNVFDGHHLPIEHRENFRQARRRPPACVPARTARARCGA